MTRIFAALGLACVLAAPAWGLEPVREGQETFISRAVFAQGKLWLLTDAGALFTITEGQAERTSVRLPEPARDLWLSGGMPAVATCPEKCAAWALHRFDGQQWRQTATIKARKDEELAAVTEKDGTIFLVSLERVIEYSSAGEISHPYYLEVMGPRRITSVFVDPKRILIGVNTGEWGGGLFAIDRSKHGPRYQKGLDACHSRWGCEPVNGIEPEPWNPDCLIVAAGLVHFGPNGRLVEVCSTEIRRLYYRNLRDCDENAPQPTEPGVPRCIKHDGEFSFEEEAFFGLARHGDTVWAAGVTGLYRITKDGVSYLKDRPKVTMVGGIPVSFDFPGVVIVFTEINERASLSGSTPMIVPRGEN